jgi:hypothetical protein
MRNLRNWLALGTAAVALAGCSANESAPRGREAGQDASTAEASASEAASNDPAKAAPVKVTLPQLTYVYKLGFLLPGAKIAEAQDAHRAACVAMGPARCQLIALQRASSQDSVEPALLQLRVASADAQSFSDSATRTVTDAGGRAADTNVAAEDVSKQIVDAEARIKQRETLVARLTEILRNRKGKVEELVEAERSVAAAQEELDQTRAWVTELRGRVAMSDFEIRYTAIAANASPDSVGASLGDALTDSGSGFILGVRSLLVVLIYLAPWLLLALPVVLLFRRLRRKPAGAGIPGTVSGDG